jgi:hypothetical protein
MTAASKDVIDVDAQTKADTGREAVGDCHAYDQDMKKPAITERTVPMLIPWKAPHPAAEA